MSEICLRYDYDLHFGISSGIRSNKTWHENMDMGCILRRTQRSIIQGGIDIVVAAYGWTVHTASRDVFGGKEPDCPIMRYV